MRIGIDVGGTNTDAVIVDGKNVIAWAKVPTTPDVASGIEKVLQEVIAGASLSLSDITAVMLGTTHFANAIVQRKNLTRVGVIRLSLPVGTAVPPLEDWPVALREAISPVVHQVHGGFEVIGVPVAAMDPREIETALAEFRREGIRNIAVTGVFSPMDTSQEEQVARMAEERIPGVRVSLGKDIGTLGLLERENACVLNAALADVAESVVDGFEAAIRASGLAARIFLTQNDGTLMSAATAKKYPVRTVGSGPTNSMRGAASITGLKDVLVVDVGGTTTDVGVLVNGFPRPAALTVSLGGVRTNFRMPDVFSLGLGGGSIVRPDGDSVRVGPDSVGYRLTREGLSFGGDTPTVTDGAIAAGRAQLGSQALAAPYDRAWGDQVMATVSGMVSAAVDRMKTAAVDVTVVLVGGGSVCIPDQLVGVREILRPAHAQVANALGAALAQVGAEVDRVADLEPAHRRERLDQLRNDVVHEAVLAGAASDTAEVVEIDETPLAYMPGHQVRVRMRAVGDLP